MYRTIDAENKKAYRRALDVVIALESPIYTDDNGSYVYVYIPSNKYADMYGGEEYFDNSRATTLCKKVPVLMDFAGGGFYNDGNAYPIQKENLGGGSGYGYVAAKTNVNYMSIGVATSKAGELLTEDMYIHACVRDSKGKCHYIKHSIDTASSNFHDTYYFWHLTKDDIPGFPEDERIYVEYAFAGDAVRFNNDELIDCTVNLRSVETRVADPDLQMSEIELKAYCPKRKVSIKKFQEGTRIRYAAGYFSDMSYQRTFYVNDKVRQDKRGTIRVTGYDATTFLDYEFGGGTNYALDANYHSYPSDLVDFINNKLPRDLTVFDDMLVATNSAPDSYKYKDCFYPNENMRSVIANMCNTFRATAKSYMNKGLYVDYVDAGYPIMRMSNKLYSTSVYEGIDAVNVNLGKGTRKIENWQMTDYDINYDDIYKTYKLPNYWIMGFDMKEVVETITLDPGESKWFESKEPVYLWVALIDGAQVDDIEIQTAYKALVKNSSTATRTYSVKRFEMPYAYASKSPFIARRKDGSGTHTFPVIWGQMDAYQTSSKTTTASFFASAIVNIAKRSEETWTFTWRGDPRMQPRDIIKVAEDNSANPTYQELTIDTITLEHSENGGLTSEIVARKGRV